MQSDVVSKLGAHCRLATSGDTHLGGADFDQRIMDHFMKRMLLKEEIDIRHNKRALAKLRREAEVQ